MQLQADGVRLAIASPMASAASEARSDHPASAMPVIEACGKHVLCTGDAQALCVIASPVPFAEAVIARPRFRPHGRGRPHGIAFASRAGDADGHRVGDDPLVGAGRPALWRACGVVAALRVDRLRRVPVCRVGRWWRSWGSLIRRAGGVLAPTASPGGHAGQPVVVWLPSGVRMSIPPRRMSSPSSGQWVGGGCGGSRGASMAPAGLRPIR